MTPRQTSPSTPKNKGPAQCLYAACPIKFTNFQRTYYCDACELAICTTHAKRHRIFVGSTTKFTFILCPHCAEKFNRAMHDHLTFADLLRWIVEHDCLKTANPL